MYFDPGRSSLGDLSSISLLPSFCLLFPYHFCPLFHISFPPPENENIGSTSFEKLEDHIVKLHCLGILKQQGVDLLSFHVLLPHCPPSASLYFFTFTSQNPSYPCKFISYSISFQNLVLLLSRRCYLFLLPLTK